jgi:hypothetical protein
MLLRKGKAHLISERTNNFRKAQIPLMVIVVRQNMCGVAVWT